MVTVFHDGDGVMVRDYRYAHELCAPETHDKISYVLGIHRPNYPVPAVVYQTVFPWEDAGYLDMIYVNDMGCEWDPILVACWDWYDTPPEWVGKYQPCYPDLKAQWYRKHGAWSSEPVNQKGGLDVNP